VFSCASMRGLVWSPFPRARLLLHMHTSESTLIAGLDAAHAELAAALGELRTEFEQSGARLPACRARRVAFSAGQIHELAQSLVLLCVAAPLGARVAAAILDVHGFELDGGVHAS
jgi:hypothetical protein